MKSLERLYARRYPGQGGYTLDQARELGLLSQSLGRQLGLLIDRKGRPSLVIAGSPGRIYIPELARARGGGGRLRGLRLLHTHLNNEPLSREDLTDMLFLRLDSVAALGLNQLGEPKNLYAAHLLPREAASAGEPYEVLPPQPFERMDLDFTGIALALEEELAREGQSLKDGAESSAERAILVGVSNLARAALESQMDELACLADTAGLLEVGRVVQRVAALNPKFILGKGKLAELEVQALHARASVLLFEGELSPAQIRNLAEVTELKILDRTQLILDIFAQRASTSSGKLQVEMAQLKYTLPRLVGQNRAMSRLMGGIGGRGPGETKLEMDRRKIRERISRIKNDLKDLRKRRGDTRARRAKAAVPVVSLVGYTNAGKSTLLNTLTASRVLAEDKLFATLDPVSRRLRFPQEREIILTDTVGFIRELPSDLREAFEATLEEIKSAELLVQVADASHPELEGQLAAVDSILREMELGDTPRILALNKWDRLSPDQAEFLRQSRPEAVPISALSREGLEPLVAEIIARINWTKFARVRAQEALSS